MGKDSHDWLTRGKAIAAFRDTFTEFSARDFSEAGNGRKTVISVEGSDDENEVILILKDHDGGHVGQLSVARARDFAIAILLASEGA